MSEVPDSKLRELEAGASGAIMRIGDASLDEPTGSLDATPRSGLPLRGRGRRRVAAQPSCQIADAAL